MSKNIIIALVIAVLVWGGFMLYRKHKLEYDQQVRAQKEYDQLMNAARRSPIAGLTSMGRALNEYYKVNNVYPPKLMDLHPDFIPSEQFIQELDWEYERSERDFYLSKRTMVSGKPMIAYVDSQLQPDIDTEATMASKEERKERLRLAAAEAKRKKIMTKRGRLQEERRARKKGEEFEEEEYEDGLASIEEITSEPLSEDFKAYPTPESRQPEPAGQWVMSEEGTNLEYKTDDLQAEILVDDAEDVSESLTRISERFLVWKTMEGVHGFGNVQYPAAERISIAVHGKWRYLNWPSSDEIEADASEVGREEEKGDGAGSKQVDKTEPRADVR